MARRRRPPKAKALVGGHAGGRRLRAVRDRMVRDGVFTERDHRVLGIFPTKRRHPIDPAEANALRERIRRLSLGDHDPTQAATIAAITAAGAVSSASSSGGS